MRFHYQIQRCALFQYAFAQIAQAEHGEGIGYSFDNRQCIAQRTLAVAASEANVQTAFDQIQLFFNGAYDRTHSIGVRHRKHILIVFAAFFTFQQCFFQMVGFVDAL